MSMYLLNRLEMQRLLHEQTRNASHFSFALLAGKRHSQSCMQAYSLPLTLSASAHARKKPASKTEADLPQIVTRKYVRFSHQP